ncbi:lipoprotein [Serratia sp. BNK-17]|uniref:lipoprotein n=1 Tax=Serratia sp. BNK-17 TaxID=3376154 RepID=UPI003B427A09
MKKSLLLFIPLFVSGCPMGNKVNLRPAKATAVGSKICVFFDKNDMEREESILKVAIWKYGNMGIWEYGNMGIWEYGNMGIWKYGNMEIWKYGNDNYVYEKSYENTPVALEPGKCVPGIGEYDFILGEGRSVIVSTPLHPYEARFIVWKRGEEVVLK